MKRILTGLLSSLLVSAPALAQSIQAVPGEYIVKYKSSAVSVSNVRAKLSSKASMQKAFPAMGMYHISMKAGVGEAANLQDIKADPDVEYVEPNYIWDKGDTEPSNNASATVYQSSYTYSELLSNTRAKSDNHFYQAILDTGVEAAWTKLSPLVTNEHKIVVAIVDTGVDTSHKLYQSTSNGGANALWVNTRELNGQGGVDDDSNGYVDDISGWNFITNTSNYLDDDDHGTHVAGIVVGAGQNIFANPLAESKVQIMPLKFLNASGSGTTTAAINAIYYAVNNGADIINNSWGGPNYSRALHEALSYAYDHQVLIVSAAGNNGLNNEDSRYPIYPANYDVPSNIAVASSTNYQFNPALSSFSNYGPNLVHVASPGEDILSTVKGTKYGSMSGTSMAAPFVAGMAALALREDRILTGYQLKQLILSSAVAKPLFAGYISSGALIDANNLITTAKSSVGTMSTYQPEYKAQLRGVASDAPGAGGCGLVSTAVLRGPSGGGDGPTPMGGVVCGLLMLPLIVWFALRSRDPKNQRRHERFRMSSEIRVMVGDRELVGAVNTISQGGLSFNTDQALEKGGIVTMRIASPDGHEVIEVQGQVVWSEANQAYGVQFANARQGTLAMIQQWTQALGKS